MSESAIKSENSSSRQDTALEIRKRNAMMSEPDTNFTWEKYANFLVKISDTSKYIVLPLNEFRQTFDYNKIVIGLRHDVDNDLNIAFNFSEVEWKMGFRSTYFILHTAPYYLSKPGNMALHSQSIIPILKTMQDERKFEIGWHNDLVTLQLIYKLDPVAFLFNELAWLRQNGINIIGTAAHGSTYCKTYHYMNYYFFNECTLPVVPNRENNIYVPIGGVNIPIMKGNLNDFGLEYEAYFLNNNKTFSDATITNGVRWDIGMLKINQLQPGDRVIILLHPIHWHKASVQANIESFRLPQQTSSFIDAGKSEISVELPYEPNANSLAANFILSPGAYVKVSGKLQVNGYTGNNFTNPVTYTVYAENRSIRKEWKVIIHTPKETICDFKLFSIPNVTKSVTINTIQKTVLIKVNEFVDITHLTPHFELSDGAHAWVGNRELFSDYTYLDLTNPVEINIISKDSLVIKSWTINVIRETNISKSESLPTELLIYPNPNNGILHLQLRNIITSPTIIDIYNGLGEKVYMDLITKTGDFTEEADLTSLPSGVYVLKCSGYEKSVIFIIRKQ